MTLVGAARSNSRHEPSSSSYGQKAGTEGVSKGQGYVGRQTGKAEGGVLDLVTAGSHQDARCDLGEQVEARWLCRALGRPPIQEA